MESIEYKCTEKLVVFLKSVCIFSTLNSDKLNDVVRSCRRQDLGPWNFRY
ncbi:MAG: hypothetical protein RR128_07910 [Clostridium sp.]